MGFDRAQIPSFRIVSADQFCQDKDWQELRPLSIRLVIMSRGRARSMTSHKLFPSADIFAPLEEFDDYAAVLEASGISQHQFHSVPKNRQGISAVRNWIREYCREDAVVMIDDDIKACVSLVSLRGRKLLPDEIVAMISNTAHCAHGAGARIFGWHQRSDPKLLNRADPFGLHHWVGGVLGVIGKDTKWDELLRCKCDIDACLSEFRDRRIVWQDARFCFVQERDKNLGGNSLFRSAERIAVERRYLKSKWKGHIRFEEYKSQERVAIDVQRRQPLTLV
jgi:glycosyltransferase involved in cell wall biosynthesis